MWASWVSLKCLDLSFPGREEEGREGEKDGNHTSPSLRYLHLVPYEKAFERQNLGSGVLKYTCCWCRKKRTWQKARHSDNFKEAKHAGVWEMKHLQAGDVELRKAPVFYVLLLLHFLLLLMQCNKCCQVLEQIRVFVLSWLRNYPFWLVKGKVIKKVNKMVSEGFNCFQSSPEIKPPFRLCCGPKRESLLKSNRCPYQ